MIFVEPTTPGRPVTALIMQPGGVQELGDEGYAVLIEAVRVSYSNDSGLWLFEDGTPVDIEIGNVITEHAKNLGCTLA